MEDPTSWVEEQARGIKYRASCDACNEAKVRCSRIKPTCARCQNSQISCIYGLSRRSHKTAPRIGCSIPSQQQQRQQQQSQKQQQQSPKDDLNSPTTTVAGSNRHFSTSTNGSLSTPNPSMGFSEFTLDADFTASLIPGPFLMDSSLQDSTKGAEFGLNISDLSDLGREIPLDDYGLGGMDATHIVEEEIGGFPSPMTFDPASSSSNLGSHGTNGKDSAIGDLPPVSYSSRIVMKLASNSLLLVQKGFALDVQLSQLKTTTSFAEECLQASSCDWDDMAPLAISLLVGSIISGFENSLEDIKTSKELQASSSQQAANMQPHFKWGALHIENEEELLLLKRSIWQIQFQRVDAMLLKFSSRIKGMKHEQMDQATSQKIRASYQTQVWLEQRAQHVRQKFSSFSSSESSSTGYD